MARRISLTIAILAVGVGISVISVMVSRFKSQRDTIRAIIDCGGSVVYSYEHADTGIHGIGVSPYPQFVLDIFGEEPLHDVAEVTLSGPSVSSHVIERVSGLEGLLKIQLQNVNVNRIGIGTLNASATLAEVHMRQCKIEDMSQLSQLKRIERMAISNSELPHATLAQFSQMKELASLVFDDCNMHQTHHRKLQSIMPKCVIVVLP